MLDQEGLVGALQRRLDAVERRAGMEAHLLATELPPLPESVAGELYRIAQEALNNVLKHAAATSVTVRISTEGESQQLRLEVVDDGTGFEPETVRDGGGVGLANMQQRAEALGAKLEVISSPGRGTKVSISVGVRRNSQGAVEAFL
jgi:signal transduction histidine kinase